MTLRRSVLALLALAALTTGAPTPASAAIPPGAEYSEAYFPAADGTMLHADVLRPNGLPADAKTPVILTVSPYTNHGGQTMPEPGQTFGGGPNGRFDDLILGAKVLERGYTYVYVDLRGFGGSAGCNDWGGPGEQMDVKAAVEWAASQPWSTGKVGMYGKSYDGWTGLMGMAQRPAGLAAVVAMEPVYDGYRYLFMNGVRFANALGTPTLFSANDAQPGRPTDSIRYHLNGTGVNAACYALNISRQQQDDPTVDFWKVRNLVDKVQGVKTPLLLTQGFLEDNTKPDAAFAFYNALAGTENRLWLGPWDHVRGNDREDGAADGRLLMGREGWFDEVMRFLDHHVKGVPLVDAPVHRDPKIALQGSDGTWRSEARWPPADARTVTAPLRDGSFADDGANEGTGSAGGIGVWTISAPLAHAAILAGAPTLRATVDAGARSNLVANVYDIGPDRKATMVSRAAQLVRASGPVELELYANDWTFEAGHRVGVLLSSANAEWWQHVPTLGTVSVSDASMTLPFLQFSRPSDLPGRKAAKLESFLASAPFEVPEATIAAATANAFPLPPASTPRPVAAAPPTSTPGTPAGRRLVARIGRRGRSLVVFGSAPTGFRLSARIQRRVRVRTARGSRPVFRTQSTKTRTVKLGSFRISVPARSSGGRYRAVVTATKGRTTLRATTGRVRVPVAAGKR